VPLCVLDNGGHLVFWACAELPIGAWTNAVRSGQSVLVTEDAEPGEWQRRFEESVAREDAKHEAEPAGCLSQLTDLHLWAGTILIPLGLAAAGLGWVATRLGWPRWVGLSAACAVAGAVACVLIAKRMNSRRRGP
jgi:hypothetical protein